MPERFTELLIRDLEKKILNVCDDILEETGFWAKLSPRAPEGLALFKEPMLIKSRALTIDPSF